MYSWNASTGHWRQPSCATQTNTLGRGTSPGYPQNPHGIQSGPACVSSRDRIRRSPKNSQWATDSDSWPSWTSAPHHPTTPPQWPPQTSWGSMPRIPGHIRAQRPPEVYAHLPPSGHNAPDPPTVVPTRSCHRERKHCNSLWVAGLPPYQPKGSSRPTY
jgi:hypothetical protein